MTFRNLDNNHDWTFGIGKNNYVSGDMEILLNAKTRVLSFLGDCFFAPEEGIDWWNLLEYNRQLQLENSVMDTIAKTDGITSIPTFDSYINANRKIALNFGINTVNGTYIEDNIVSIV